MICPKADVMVDERRLDQLLMFLYITKKLHCIGDGPIDVVSIAKEVFADQGFVACKQFFNKGAHVFDCDV